MITYMMEIEGKQYIAEFEDDEENIVETWEALIKTMIPTYKAITPQTQPEKIKMKEVAKIE